VVATFRFIPAHAGNSRLTNSRRHKATVHPRARGEQMTKPLKPDDLAGSSPRTRGTAAPDHRQIAPVRFIPAHAGNSNRLRAALRARPVHPRARGEQVVELGAIFDQGGSSPRTRGTAAQHRDQDRQPRFIPAHAGNRCRGWVIPHSNSVHPRARGEQLAGYLIEHGHDGSSPRTRGTDIGQAAVLLPDRFIPAHAGNSAPKPNT